MMMMDVNGLESINVVYTPVLLARGPIHRLRDLTCSLASVIYGYNEAS